MISQTARSHPARSLVPPPSTRRGHSADGGRRERPARDEGACVRSASAACTSSSRLTGGHRTHRHLDAAACGDRAGSSARSCAAGCRAGCCAGAGGGRPRFRSAAPCREVFRPALYSGIDVLTVLTVDMSKGLPAVDSDAMMGGGQTVYASPKALYVATPSWARSWPGGVPPSARSRGPQVRHLRARPDCLPRERRAAPAPPEPVLALRARRRAARGHAPRAPAEARAS